MRKRTKRSRAEWTALVAEWQAGDMTKQAFAQSKGLAPTTFSWWACRLRREARAESPALVPVEVVRDDATETSPPASLRVELAGGRVIVVPAAFDAASLRRLVAALEDGAC